MIEATPSPRPAGRRPALELGTILNSLPYPVLAIGREREVRMVNAAAEHFFGAGAEHLQSRSLDLLVPPDSPLVALIDQAFGDQGSVAEYDVVVDTPRTGLRQVTAQAAPLIDSDEIVVLSLQELSIASRIDRQLTHRGAARSVAAMAAMLAHEVKNPLSGIRGAAQLLEQNAPPQDRPLTRLICDETDRICALVDRMEMFSDRRPLERAAVNIHQVLERVRRLAETGFGRHARFVERYDPSLPPVYGNRDQLIQACLNLVKNACEAVATTGGEVALTTRYQHGVRLAVPGRGSRVHLPLVIEIEDNGGGIPDDIRPHSFEPFVTTKPNGTGLGLALVAKIIGDHGGVIDVESRPRRTRFRIMLPILPASAETDGGALEPAAGGGGAHS
jgi:two-component system nitrogen regulation sensor histidine kinase GlnL